MQPRCTIHPKLGCIHNMKSQGSPNPQSKSTVWHVGFRTILLKQLHQIIFFAIHDLILPNGHQTRRMKHHQWYSSNMAHGPPSCDQFDPSPRWITKKKSIQRKCLHQDLIKPKDLGNHSEKQICETIPSDNSWKYPYLLDSEPSKGSVVMRHISNISTCFCISELFACLQFTERSNNLFAIQVNVVIPLRNSF